MWIWIFLALTTPAITTVVRYGTWTGAAAYVIGTALALRWLRARLPWAMPEQRAWALAALIVCVLTAAFLVVYPLANAGAFGGGSDSDDSLNVAVRALLAGRYPYYEETYLGNAIHEMPGMLLLSAPFVMLGNSAYQNLFWLAAFFLVVRADSRSTTIAAILLLTVVAGCPLVFQRVVTGGNPLTNAIFTCVCLWWMTRGHRSRVTDLVTAAAFGLALSSRLNFLVLLPLAIGFEVRSQGMTTALRHGAIAGGVCFLVTAPFYFYDPANFTPLQGMVRISVLNVAMPGASAAVLTTAFALTAWLAVRGTDLFLSAAAVQAFFAAVTTILSWRLAEHQDYSQYGLFALFFLVVAWNRALAPGSSSAAA